MRLLFFFWEPCKFNADFKNKRKMLQKVGGFSDNLI